MILSMPTLAQAGSPCLALSEMDLVRHLVQTVHTAGIVADRAAIVNLYVALKSTPLVILTGPERTGKSRWCAASDRFSLAHIRYNARS